MKSPPKEGAAWAAAAALALPTFLLPIANPDLFWHLSAGRWIVEHRAFPREDWLSFTLPGSPWLDFEWLSQLIFQGVYGAAGMAGLWLLKMALLAASWVFVLRILKLHRAAPLCLPAAFALWALGFLGNADIRPELFSTAFFSAVFYLLERGRIENRALTRRGLAGIFFLFAVWANLHAGFVFGLGLLVLYGAAAAGAAAVAGSLCQPYPFGAYRVVWQHWLLREEVSRHIQEWQPMTLRNPLHWPDWLLLGLGAGLILYRLREKLPWRLVLVWLFCAVGMLLHSRLAPYFDAAAVVLIFALLRAEPRRALLAGFAAAALFLLWLIPRVSWPGVFDYRHVPRRAAEFLARERAAVEGRRIFNPWEWGGYLGWRLGPWHKVYGDGRYIFHPQLAKTAEAFAESGAWGAFLEEEKVDGALLPNLDKLFLTQKRYRDGTTKPFLRPWYLYYMPKERWALVYWDEQALFFAARGAFPAEWLSRHEYRYVRPKDEAAFAEALRLGETPEDGVDAEKRRHDQEIGL